MAGRNKGIKTPLDLLKYILLTIITVVIIVVMIAPFAWMVSGSLKSSELVFVYPPIFIPPKIMWENYARIFKELPFARYMLNSFFVSSSVVILGLFVNSLAGYSFARIPFKGSTVIFVLILATMMIPGEMIILPLFLIVKSFGWFNTYNALIFPGVVSPFGIFLLRQFFKGLPVELEEAATIDGCSRFGIYWRIALPLAKPALLTLSVLTFMWNWDSFLWPLIVITSEEMRVVQIGLALIVGQQTYSGFWNVIMAASVVACLPTIFIFMALQKYYVQGVATTGLKG